MKDSHTDSPIPINDNFCPSGASLPSAGRCVPLVSIFSIFFLSLGVLINAFSYLSFAPVLVAIIFYGFIYVLLAVTPMGGGPERRMFSCVFSVGFLMAGVAAVYANQLQDAGQLFSDAGSFFEMAAGKADGLTLAEIQVVHEGALGIALWRAVYDFFAILGFEKARYIGTTINITAVALAGVIGIKFIRQIFGNDEYRFRRLTLLVAPCGLFWIFAGIHIRDSIILLAVTALAYAWLYFLAKPDLGVRLLQVILWSLLAGAFFGFLRGEFVFVPIAMAIAAVGALLIGRVERRRRRVVYSLVFIGSVVVAILAINYAAEIIWVMNRGQTGYGELAGDQHGADSLGISLIVSQPLPIRLVLGSIYLFVFPIPFWSGFQLESAYNLFKSANAIYFYFVFPLLLIAVFQIAKKKSMRTPALFFMLFMSAGFTLAVAATSLETRHFGVFLMPILTLSVLPDLREMRAWSVYKAYLFLFLCGVLIVHVAWIALKLL